MDIKLIGELKTVMSNPDSKHCYFGWPSAVRLQNGKIAVTASGFRMDHVCPFGKMVISYSEDDGESFTPPAPVIDTPLDDRDGGIITFGESGVMVTSFNNTTAVQRVWASKRCDADRNYIYSYLDTVSPEAEAKYLGSTFKFSNDCGKSFGELHISPVTSPHGPVVLPDGRILWVGRTFSDDDAVLPHDKIKAYIVNLDGSMEFVGEIDNIPTGEDGVPISCEPHCIVLDDGTILVHIRVQIAGGSTMFTIYQSESHDFGKTWTTPRQLLDKRGGAPSHLFKHSSGMLIATYGYRCQPCGIKAMFSRDNGKTWDTNPNYYLFESSNADLGYPATVELADGSLLTFFYAHVHGGRSEIYAQRWSF